MEICVEIKDSVVGKCTENFFDTLKTGQNLMCSEKLAPQKFMCNYLKDFET